jgi:outer membrane protein assembly factor BamB
MTMRLLLLVLLLATSTFAADWPGFYGPTRNGHSTETKLNWDWKKTPPKQLWSIPVAKGNAGPVVVGGIVYLWVRDNDADTLLALDAATGKEKWKYTRGGRGDEGPQVTPLVVGEFIYALGYGGKLSAMHIKDEKKCWSRDLKKDFAAPEGYFGVGAGLLAHDGKLMVNAGGKDAGIVALNLETGKDIWKVTSDPPSYSTPVTMELNKKPHAVFFTRTGLQVIDVEKGTSVVSKRHRATYDASVNAAAPIVKGNEVFLSAEYGTGAVKLTIGADSATEVWGDDKTLSCHFNTPVLVDDLLFGVHGRQEGRSADLVCINWKTGESHWREANFGVAHLIHVDGGMLALNESGELIRFEAVKTGFKEVGRIKTLEGLTRAPPALADGVVYLRDGTTLTAYSVK